MIKLSHLSTQTSKQPNTHQGILAKLTSFASAMTEPAAALVRFEAYQRSFAVITGPNPASKVLRESGEGASRYHEACIWHEPSRSIIITSNQLSVTEGARREQTSNKRVILLRIYDAVEGEQATEEEVEFPGIEGAMLNGGVNYRTNSILLCAQGSRDLKDVNGIIELELTSLAAPTTVRTEAAPRILVADFYGIPFNSVNDVVVHPEDGSIWFTDPSYGYHQGIRPEPQLPNHVYRYDPANRTIRAVADGFVRPNGICFSPDLRTVYITDTGYIHGSPDVPHDPARPSHVYAFDIVQTGGDGPATSLTNRRLFAYAPGKCPDGIKTDMNGNVYSGCLDGIAVWDPRGVPLGLFQIDGGVANFCFGDPGVIYACNETRLIKITIDPSVQGALLGTHRPPR